MWDLDDWKDFAEVIKNFADTALAIVAALALLRWRASRKNEGRSAPADSSREDGDRAAS